MPPALLLRVASPPVTKPVQITAASGELLAEARALQTARYDLDGKARRAIALEELEMAVSVETLEHEEGCGCGERTSFFHVPRLAG